MLAPQPGADLALAKTVNDPTPNVGDTITFTVTLTNAGPVTATSVEVSDLLPAGLSFVFALPSQGSYDPASGLWDVGAVTAGASQTLLVGATVVSPKRQKNKAKISHADQVDPHKSNNSASATETPQQADLGLAKTVSNRTPNVGDMVAFTITLSNKGPDTATNVQVSDPLPAGLDVDVGDAEPGRVRLGQRPVDGRNGDLDYAADASADCDGRLAERPDEHGGDLAR